MVNRSSSILHLYNISTTSTTSLTSLQHLYNISTTSLQHINNISTTSLQHLYNISTTFFQRIKPPSLVRIKFLYFFESHWVTTTYFHYLFTWNRLHKIMGHIRQRHKFFYKSSLQFRYCGQHKGIDLGYQCDQIGLFFMWPFPASLSLFSSFQYSWQCT